jgi:hypothetical protein
MVGTFTVTIGARQFLIDTTNTGWILYLATSGYLDLATSGYFFMAMDTSE